MIYLKHAIVSRDGDATVTQLRSDGASVRAVNSGDDYQRQIAGWVGCGDDIPRYNFEHEVIHSFISEKMHDAESYVIEREARYGGRMSKTAGLFEERWCYHFHQWLNCMVPEPKEPEWEDWRVELWTLLGRDLTEWEFKSYRARVLG